MKYNLPFYEQKSNLDCGPVALKMCMEFLGKEFDVAQIGKACGVKEGKGVSTIRLVIGAAKLGFKTRMLTKSLGFNMENMNLDFYKNVGDLNFNETEELVKEAVRLGAELEEKQVGLGSLLKMLNDKTTIIILLDWSVVKGKEGYQGHFAPVVGFDESNVYVHNPGGSDAAPFYPIKKEVFENARKAVGTDEDILVISV